MCKRLMFLVLGLGALALLGATASAATYDLRIANNMDDMEEKGTAGSMDTSSSDIEIPYEDAPLGPDKAQIIGLRWALPIAKGAMITKAYVEFTCDETKLGTEPVNLVIEGQLIPNAPAFTSTAKNVSSRTTRTKAQVKCSLPTWTKENETIQTADLSPILQELVDQDGWVSGNTIVLILTDDASNPSKGIRGAEAREGEAAQAALLHVEVFAPEARNPDPANGAQDVTSPLFQWVAGDGAVSHQVYVGTKPELGDADKAGAPLPMNMYFHIPGLTPGVTYYWRVDEIDAAGKIAKGPVWSFTVMPLEAHFPSPADKATDVKLAGQLKWTAGQNAIGHTVFLGTDKAAVEKGDAKAQVAAGVDPKYDFTGLKPFSTYYWRVDEVGSTGQMIPGPAWSFSTVNYAPMNDAPVPLNYNNSAAPFTSEVTLTGETNWTANGVTDLTLQFTGQRANFVDKGNGAFTVGASGHDIWDAADDFRFVYQKLSGDGSIAVKVESLANTNAWAKAGVMIRQSLEAGSPMVDMVIASTNGANFQWRATVGANASSTNSPSTPNIKAPQWVKLMRKGNVFSGQYSADGQTWLDIKNPALTGTPVTTTVEMAGDVYIGLCLTSHDRNLTTVAEFSGAATTGTATGAWQQAWIGVDADRTNSPSDLYATVEDSKGKTATVQYGDPMASTITQPWTWKIPLTSFTGVDLKNVAKLYLGAGNKLTPAADGSGVVTFDNVRVVQPVVLARGADVTLPGDNVLGVPNNGNWPAAETPRLALDNNPNTKFLHFNGKSEPVGFQVQVLAGATIVTGLTFTTANDAPERDPVAFELSGSNDGLQGPWTLIAKGDIVDFKGATAWPRFTKNTTPITFENNVAYKFYQVMFTAVRDPKTANSMQIADVELLNGANIIWVSDGYDDKKDSIRDDQDWIDFLTAQGYRIDYRMGPALGNGYWRTLNQAKLDALNAADLVIFSRNANSGDYNNGNERDQWNSVKTPLLLLSPHLTRSSHWKWLSTTTINTAVPMMQPVDVNSPAFKNVTRDAKGQIAVLGPTMGTSFPGLKTAGNGAVLATRADTGEIWIASWAAGKEFYTGSGQIPAGPRVFFAAGLQEAAGTATAPALGRGEFNLTDSGKALFLNVMDMLLP